MPWTLREDELDSLGRGLELLGGGGGGTIDLMTLSVRAAARLPVEIVDIDDYPGDTPCLAIGIAGTSVMLSERLPSLDDGARAIAAAERWLGHRIPAVCSTEHAGTNGLASVLFRGDRMIADADLMGRALPRIDQLSLLADEVPGLVLTIATSGAGVVVIDNPRTSDAEVIVRESVRSMGGWAVLAISGFTFNSLREHAMLGTFARALEVGAALQRHTFSPAAVESGGRWIGTARVMRVSVHPGPADVLDIELQSPAGDVARLVGESEFSLCMWNGEIVGAAPDIVTAADTWSDRILQITDVKVGMMIAIATLDAPAWWHARPHRTARARHGIVEQLT